MAKQYTKQKTVVRRSATDYAVTELPKLHRNALLTLVNYCILDGINFYIGKTRRDGTLPVKLYTEDGPVEDYLCPEDEPITWAAELGKEYLDKSYHTPLADDLTALAAQRAPGAAKAASLVRRVAPAESEA